LEKKTVIAFENVQTDIFMEIKKQRSEDAWKKYPQQVKDKIITP